MLFCSVLITYLNVCTVILFLCIFNVIVFFRLGLNHPLSNPERSCTYMRFIDIYAYVLSTGVLLHDTSDLLWIICTYLCLNISSKRPSKHDTIEPMSAECRGISAMTYRCRTDVMSLMLVICSDPYYYHIVMFRLH